MAFQQQAFPRLNTPLVDERGNVSLPWYKLLQSLWQSAGSGYAQLPSSIFFQYDGANLIAYDVLTGEQIAIVETTPVLSTPFGRSLLVLPNAAAFTAVGDDFVGDSGAGGLKGLVPAPAAGDAVALKFLSAAGGWIVPPTAGGAITQVAERQFTASDTYVPTAGTLYAMLEALGAGGGGGAVAGAAGYAFGASGGGSGSRSFYLASAAELGASQVITIGAKGTGGAAGFNAGTNGGDTSIGALCIGKGGQGGGACNSGAQNPPGQGGTPGTGTTTTHGQSGFFGSFASITTVLALGGPGGSSPYGGGGIGSSNAAGNNGAGYGTGGGGASAYNTATNRAGGDATDGLVRITEFIAA